MGKVIAGFALSLDGFIADAQDGVHLLFQWLAGGDTPVVVEGRTFKTSALSAAQFQERIETTGAVVTGRRDFDVSQAWNGKPPIDVPFFIVTHTPPQAWTHADAPFTFVTAGVESAVEKAQHAAGNRNVIVSGSKITQQCIAHGLLDEIHLDLVPVLLGTGIRLFEALEIEARQLEILQVLDAPGVTHLRYRFVR